MADKLGRRVPNRWGEGGQLREEIVAAAGRLLAESGREEGLSLRAVAREVGVAAPSIYLHFKDRSELVVTVMREVYGTLAAELVRARSQAPVDDPESRLRAMAHRYCGFALENQRRYRLMFGVEQNEISRERETDHPVYEIRDLWVEALHACHDAGRVGNLDAYRAALLLWSGLHGVLALWIALPFTPDLEMIYGMADDLISVLLAK